MFWNFRKGFFFNLLKTLACYFVLSFSISFIFDKRLGGCEVFEGFQGNCRRHNATFSLVFLARWDNSFYSIDTLLLFFRQVPCIDFSFKKI